MKGLPRFDGQQTSEYTTECVLFRLIRSVWRRRNFPCLKLIEIVILWVYYHLFWLQLVLALFGHFFLTFYTTCLAKDH